MQTHLSEIFGNEGFKAAIMPEVISQNYEIETETTLLHGKRKNLPRLSDNVETVSSYSHVTTETVFAMSSLRVKEK